jgi:uncharacterized protein (TIGR03435 family)
LGNRVRVQPVTLFSLVEAAYQVRDYQVSGGPSWARAEGGDLWNIEAKAAGDGPVSMDSARRMLQALIEDRFQLKLRRSSKEVPVYNLAIAKGGARLNRVAPDALPPAPNIRRGSLEEIARMLDGMLDRPVIDKTGLEGIYEFDSGALRRDLERQGDVDRDDLTGATLTAIQSAWGLKAEPGKATLEMLIIESAEKPKEN